MERAMVFDPDGSVRTVYSDDLPLRELGRIATRRASQVEFDPVTQTWIARTVEGERIASGPRRDETVAAEIAILQERL